MEFKRADRVAELIKEEISVIIQRDVSDPRVLNTTITEVKVTDDLKLAKVYFVCDPSHKDKAIQGFERSQGFIKKMLAAQIKLRYMPKLKFYYDSSLDYSSKIGKILKEINEDDDR